MKNPETKKLSIEKFTIAKLKNSSFIYGGGDDTDGQGDTVKVTQKPPPPTQNPTETPTQNPTQ